MSEFGARCGVTLGVIASQLVGVWSLVSFTEQREGLGDSYPFGPKPEGFLIYTVDGFVSAQLMKPGRSRFQARDWLGGSPEEYREPGNGYIAYCGIWKVDEEGKTVTHVPSVALVPNLIHAEQLRSVVLNGETLTLRTMGAQAGNDAPPVSRLEWKRTKPTAEVDGPQ